MSATIGSIGVGSVSGGGGGSASDDFDYLILCDTHAGVVTKFLRTFRRDSSGILTIANTYFDGSTPYTILGAVGPCSGDSDHELIKLYDNNGGTVTKFLRRYTIGVSGAVTFIDTELDGITPYATTGIVESSVQDSRHQILCDDNGAFLRIYGFGSGDYLLDGFTPYAPSGTVRICSPSQADDSEVIVLCDNGTAFLRHYIRSAEGVVTTSDTQLDGTSPYTTVGTIGVCGASEHTIESHIKDITAGNEWTPADVPATATLIGLGLSVLSGTCDITDAGGNDVLLLPTGYNASWSADDSNQLVPVQRIAASPIDGRVVVTMLVKT